MSTQVIPADIEINEQIVSSVISEQFQFRVENVSLLGEGYDNAVYLINNKWVFRFPRREIAVSLILKEMLILPALAGRISLTIPSPVYIGQPSPLFARPFYGHAYVDGRSGCAIDLSMSEFEQAAITLARFLRELHNIDYRAIGLTTEELKPLFDRANFEVINGIFEERWKSLVQYYDLKPFSEKKTLIQAYAAHYNIAKLEARLVQGDLYHRHLLFNDHNELKAVIDWGDSCVANPVADLGVVFQFFPKETHDIFFKEYGHVDDETKCYARFLGLYYAAALLWFGHDRNDTDLIRTSLRTLSEI